MQTVKPQGTVSYFHVQGNKKKIFFSNLYYESWKSSECKISTSVNVLVIRDHQNCNVKTYILENLLEQ